MKLKADLGTVSQKILKKGEENGNRMFLSATKMYHLLYFDVSIVFNDKRDGHVANFSTFPWYLALKEGRAEIRNSVIRRRFEENQDQLHLGPYLIDQPLYFICTCQSLINYDW